MTFYILLALSSFLMSLLGTRLTILAFRKRVVPIDPASLRAGYKKPPLSGGGVAVVMSLVISLMVADINYAIVLGMFMLAATSLLDELIDIPLPVRLLVQLLSVLIALNVVPVPTFGGMLPMWLAKGVMAVLWVWYINLFKMMDGIDGMSPMEMVCVGMGLCILVVLAGNSFPDPLSTYALILAASGCGFLWWNWHPAKILLGDVGAIPIGFLMGYLLILTIDAGYPYAAVILPAYYLSDVTITVIRRIYHGKKLFAVYSDYYYLRALRSGRKQQAVVRYIFGINFLLIFQAIFSVIDPALSIFYVGLAYASVFMILGFFAHTAHDPKYEPF
jgi:UDP-N-acetylmuramyl pentapeptide phosphotransferase/UDP-N-acetylglucosamine-1-phosphate transferase